MKKITLVCFALVALALSACTPLFAADTIPAHAPEAVLTFGAALKGFLVATVFPIISAFVLGLVTILLNRLGEKYKIQALTENNNFLFRLAAQGIALAEERAAKLAGSVDKLTGNQKLDIAVAHLLTYAPQVSSQQAQNIVHSVLAQIPGAGATKEAVTLLPQEGGYSIPIPGIPITEDIFAGPAQAQ